MSTPKEAQRPEANVAARPVKPGSALYRILEVVAERVAERLRLEASKSEDQN